MVGLDYASVDIVESADGWFVLEVTPTAGFKRLLAATGESPAPSIAAPPLNRIGESPDEADLERTRTRLDTSRPACTYVRSLSTRPKLPSSATSRRSGTSGRRSVLAKSDTGATRPSIDARLTADVGTGPIKDIVDIKSGNLKAGRSRPVVDVVVGIGGTQHTVSASIEDRSHMDYPLLLGRDILEHHRVDVRQRADEDR